MLNDQGCRRFLFLLGLVNFFVRLIIGVDVSVLFRLIVLNLFLFVVDFPGSFVLFPNIVVFQFASGDLDSQSTTIGVFFVFLIVNPFAAATLIDRRPPRSHRIGPRSTLDGDIDEEIIRTE